MEPKYKYFIENNQTKLWYWINLDLNIHKHNNCKCKDCTGDYSPMQGWTNDPLKVLSFPTREIAEILIKREKENLIKFPNRANKEIADSIVTEHEFVDK